MRCWRGTEVDLRHLTCNIGRWNLSELILILSIFHNSFLKSDSLISLVMDNSQWNNSDISFYNQILFNPSDKLHGSWKKGTSNAWSVDLDLESCCAHTYVHSQTKHTYEYLPPRKCILKTWLRTWLLWDSKWYSSYHFLF